MHTLHLDDGFPLEAIQRIINMKSHPKEASETQRLDKSHDEQTIIDSAKSCPTNAIILKDENGKQIWPEQK